MNSVIQATYCDIRQVKTRKVWQLVFEIPSEQYMHAVNLLGDPSRENWVAIARLNLQEGGKLDQPEALATQPATPIAETPKNASWGKFYKKLVLSGFFNNANVLEKLGTDAEYLEWIRGLKSAHSGHCDWYGIADGRCEAAHVRRVSLGAGTGIKPKFAAIPLTHDEHKLQTDKGESAIAPKEQWDKWLMDYRLQWGKMKLKQYFKVESLSELDPHTFKEWCVNNGLMLYVPKELSMGGENV